MTSTVHQKIKLSGKSVQNFLNTVPECRPLVLVSARQFSGESRDVIFLSTNCLQLLRILFEKIFEMNSIA